MRYKFLGLLVLVGIIFLATVSTITAVDSYLNGVTHFRHASIRIEGEKVVYFDPYGIKGEPHDADLVFISHTHDDHFTPSDIRKVLKEGGTVIITNDGVKRLQNLGYQKISAVAPNQTHQVEGVNFKTVPAYNPDKNYHPQKNGWVGYIVTLNGYDYYFAGDTGLIPEMNEIQADVAFLPVDGTYTMKAEEAAQAAQNIKPTVAVPMHFGVVAGSIRDAERFVALLPAEIQGVIIQGK